MKSIQERVRAQIAKQDAARNAATDEAKQERQSRRRLAALYAADVRRERRIEGICNGTIDPRNDEEDALQVRVLLDLGVDI